MNEIAILGGGIAGISAAFHLKEAGKKNIVYEAQAKCGGLVSNFSIDGFRFDNAIHMSFTKSEYVRSIFDKTPYYSHQPNAFCKDREYWLKHPIQNNLHPLPLEEKVALIESFVDRPNFEPSNYKEWLLSQYGNKIYEKYPEPYTKKYWGLEPKDLSTSWINDRVRKASISEILSGALESQNVNHYYANKMRYPKEGGYFSFIKEMSEKIDIECNKRVVNINTKSKTILFDCGTQKSYSDLISTLPLPLLCTFIDNCPKTVMQAAHSLLWTTVDLVSVGFSIPDVPPYLWFYIYDDDSMAARAYSPSMKSPENAPKGKSSMQFEIYNLSTKSKIAPDLLMENIKSKILEMELCTESEIEFLHHKHLPFGNVVFDHGMEERRNIVLGYLDEMNIKSCGRFGEWDYLWSDQSFMSGKKAADKI